MRTLSTVFVSIALLVSAAPAHAQMDPTQETGSRIATQPRNATDPAQIARFSKVVATCTFNRMGAAQIDTLLRASDARQLASDRRSPQWARLFNTLEECLGERSAEWDADVRLSNLEMGMTDTRLRALLLEEAYLDASTSAPLLLEGTPEPTRRVFVSTGTDRSVVTGLAQFSDCLVYRDAAGADALLRTTPGSPEERVAARALAPILGQCLVAGQEIGFNIASIRAMVADGLWSRVALGSGTAQ